MIEIIIRQTNADSNSADFEEVAKISIDAAGKVNVIVNKGKQVNPPLNGTSRDDALAEIHAVLASEPKSQSRSANGSEDSSNGGSEQDEYTSQSERSTPTA